MLKESKTRLLINIERDKREVLRKAAKMKKESMSSLVIYALDEFLERNGYQ